jgi:signal transduction histidine kinase
MSADLITDTLLQKHSAQTHLPVSTLDSALAAHTFLVIAPLVMESLQALSDSLLETDYPPLPLVELTRPTGSKHTFLLQTLSALGGIGQNGAGSRSSSLKSAVQLRAGSQKQSIVIAGAELLVEPAFGRQGVAFLSQLADLADAKPLIRFVLLADRASVTRLCMILDVLNVTHHALMPADERVQFGFRAERDEMEDDELIDLHQQITALQTQLESQQRHVQAVDLLKQTIVSTVSHELNTPLLQIKTAIHMLAEDSSRDRDMLLSLAIDAAARLQAQVQNINQLAQTLDFHPQPIYIRDAIDQALSNLRRSWTTKGKLDRIQIHLDADLPVVSADRKGIGIVLFHLIDNALKFSDDFIQVIATRSESGVTLRVVDQGIGVAPQIQSRIFDLFFQGDNSTTRKYGGLGIGLAIVQLILDRHGIPIELEEAAHGCSFAFSLPVAQMSDDLL